MTAFEADFASDLFASDEPRYDGVRLLLTRAGAEISTVDLVTAAESGGGVSLDYLSRLSLVFGLEPQVARESIGNLMLRSPLFAFEEPDGALWLFMTGSDGLLTCVDIEGAEPASRPAPDATGRALVFTEATSLRRGDPAFGTMRAILEWSRKPLIAIVGITFASNLLGLTLPLFTLAVYDQVLAAGEARMLAILVAGLALGLLADAILRMMRSKLVSRSAAHLDARLSSRIFGTLMRRSDGTPIAVGGATSARLRDLERIRSFVFGSVGVSLIEAPFALIYVIVLILLLGWIAIVPLGFLFAGFTVAMVLLASASRRGRAALARAEEYGSLCTEIAGRLGTIRVEGTQQIYEGRFRDASARLAEAELLQQRTAQMVQLTSGVLVSLTVLITLTVGALVSMEGGLSVGALIASIALVWRMSAPLPALLQARLRWSDVSEALAATSDLLAPSGEETNHAGGSGNGRTMLGRVAFSSVNFTYARGNSAAIRNLSFDIGAGEIVAITGHSGAGKSTLLDLVGGMLKPQFGSVTIDGVNPQQVAASTLSQSIGYLSRDVAPVPFTIREFLRLGVDPIDRLEIDDICDRLGLASEIAALPLAEETPMTDLHEGSGLARGLALARVLASNVSLLLLDEPDAASKTARTALLAELQALRGETTVLLVTHEPSFIEIADRVLILNAGALVRNCAPSDISRKRQAL